MKKFSNITGEKVSEQKPVETKVTESDLIKAGIMRLMDNFLNVQFYGPVTRYRVAGTAKVVGKEMLMEALFDMLEEFSTKDKVKLLESMKNESNDWELLDSKISELKLTLESIKDSKLVPHKEKIKSLCNRYKNKEELLEQVDKSISKIKNPETSHLRGIAAQRLISENNIDKDILKSISEKYFKKSKDLGK
jgi:hypothetical protein